MINLCSLIQMMSVTRVLNRNLMTGWRDSILVVVQPRSFAAMAEQ